MVIALNAPPDEKLKAFVLSIVLSSTFRMTVTSLWRSQEFRLTIT
jgi:hypothetical protein